MHKALQYLTLGWHGFIQNIFPNSCTEASFYPSTSPIARVRATRLATFVSAPTASARRGDDCVGEDCVFDGRVSDDSFHLHTAAARRRKLIPGPCCRRWRAAAGRQRPDVRSPGGPPPPFRTPSVPARRPRASSQERWSRGMEGRGRLGEGGGLGGGGSVTSVHMCRLVRPAMAGVVGSFPARSRLPAPAFSAVRRSRRSLVIRMGLAPRPTPPVRRPGRVLGGRRVTADSPGQSRAPPPRPWVGGGGVGGRRTRARLASDADLPPANVQRRPRPVCGSTPSCPALLTYAPFRRARQWHCVRVALSSVRPNGNVLQRVYDQKRG
jgi:hypothetical protein